MFLSLLRNTKLFRKEPRPDAIGELYGRIASAALHPALYLHGNVPDTFEGRFESVTLHVFLVMRRMKALPAPGTEAAQELIDLTFQKFDESMRQIGISDVAVPKKIKTLAHGFFGRVQAYEAALAGGDMAALTEALARNITEGGDAGALAAYTQASAARLAVLDLDGIFQAEPLFVPLEGVAT
jgi:cytochrome b pre-mRNA-processing protein 3